MNGDTYFWQGGKRIEIEQARSEATIHADSEQEVEAAARRAGVEVRGVEEVSPKLYRFHCPQDRDLTMQKLRREGIVHHVYAQRGAPEHEYLITDTFFIKFNDGTSEAAVREYFDAESLVVVERFGPLSYLVRVTDETGRNPIRTANSAMLRHDVEYAEPNLVRQLTRFDTIPTDSLFANQWHLHAPTAKPQLAVGADVKAPAAWDVTSGRREIVIAVADDGFDLTHPDFQGPNKIAGRINVIPTSSGSITADSDVHPRPGDYHGTPCLGVAGAEMNGQGTVGVAPGCALLAVRFPLSMSDAQIARMFQLVSPLADVVSCSWGFGPANAPMSSTLRQKISELATTGGRRGRGLIFCVAAGNNNCPIKDPANTTPYEFLDHYGQRRMYAGPIDRWIAAHPDVITVSAMTSEKKRSAYSSWGDEICVCAPSDNWHDLGLSTPPGLGIWTTDNEGFGTGSDFTSGSRYTGRFGGTSSATPTVAGVCGLVLSRNSSLSAAAVRKILQDTARKDLLVESATPVHVPGDFVNGFSKWFGHGLADAAAAVAAAGAQAAGSVTTVNAAATDVPIAIPDRGAPIESRIAIESPGQIAEIRVGVEIEHTYIGDLRIELIAPDGESIVLHDHVGGSGDDVDATFTPTEIPALASLIGKPIGGTWTLRVADTWFWDEGRLIRWRLGAKVSAGVLQPAARAAKQARALVGQP